MTLTRRQQAIRRRHVTASETPCLFGVDPYRSATDLWLYKTGQVEGDEAGYVAQVGHALEPLLIDWCASQIGAEHVVRNQLRVHKNKVLSATHDALVPGQPWAIQAKSTGIDGPVPDRDEWGEDGSDEVPTRVLVQCQAEMAVSDLARVYVPVQMGGIGRRLYVIERSGLLINEILRRADEFWRLVKSRQWPTEPASIDTLRRIVRTPGKQVELNDELVSLWAATQAIRLNAEQAEEEAKAAVIAALGDAEEGVSPNYTVRVSTWVAAPHTVKGGPRTRFQLKKNKETKYVLDGDHDLAGHLPASVPGDGVDLRAGREGDVHHVGGDGDEAGTRGAASIA